MFVYDAFDLPFRLILILILQKDKFTYMAYSIKTSISGAYTTQYSVLGVQDACLCTYRVELQLLQLSVSLQWHLQ